MREQIGFFREFARHPVWTGAVAPSSKWLARCITDDLGIETARVIAELGPGTGVFTKAIRARRPESALQIAVEINTQFAERLREQFPDVQVVNDSAERLSNIVRELGGTEADAVICGIPWAVFPEELQTQLLESIYATLKPGGKFATFAYLHGAWLPPGVRFRKMIGGKFRRVETTPVVWRNLPPAFVYRCEK
jgi:phospholipid N-methyltransferase